MVAANGKGADEKKGKRRFTEKHSRVPLSGSTNTPHEEKAENEGETGKRGRSSVS